MTPEAAKATRHFLKVTRHHAKETGLIAVVSGLHFKETGHFSKETSLHDKVTGRFSEVSGRPLQETGHFAKEARHHAGVRRHSRMPGRQCGEWLDFPEKPPCACEERGARGHTGRALRDEQASWNWRNPGHRHGEKTKARKVTSQNGERAFTSRTCGAKESRALERFKKCRSRVRENAGTFLRIQCARTLTSAATV